jgi:hypothetical protein
MPLTTSQVVAAEAARRLLADEAFVGILNRITADAAEKAVFLEQADAREVNRQLVLAISRIRGELQADADAPEATRVSDELSRSFE